MQLDKSKFIATFLVEAREYLSILDQGIVKLEKDPDNAELLSELFRAAHTLKGSSRMMGFMKMQDLAHHLEDFFGALKGGTKKFEHSMADEVFATLDAIRGELGKTPSPPPSPTRGEGDSVIPSSTRGEGDSDLPSPLVGEGWQPAGQEEYIRVPLGRINHLLNLIGEMVISKVKSTYKMGFLKKLTKQAQSAEKMLFDLETLIKETLDIPDEWIHNKGNILRASKEMEKAQHLLNQLHQTEAVFSNFRQEIVSLSDDIQNEVYHLNPVIEELQQKMKEIRMLPCSTIFEGFPRLVRDIAREQEKDVELVIHGGETELDKKVLEGIKGPLIHILRNAVDHGIQKKGVVLLSASQEGGGVVITVTDDGKGLDLDLIKKTALEKGLVTPEALEEMKPEEILQFVFADGFSTAPLITDVSGRGIGLNVVRTELERLKGNVTIHSEKGKGTTIRLELPLTIAILRVLMVKVGDVRWALPMANLEESLKVAMSEIATIENQMILRVRDRSVPIVPLADLLGVKSAHAAQETASIVIVNSLNKKVGFIVDGILGEEEIFIKSIGSHLGKVKGVSGATVMASGDMIVILDVQDLVAQMQEVRTALQPSKRKKAEKKKKRVLIVEDSLTTRELEKTILQNCGYEVETAIDGLDALDKVAKGHFDAIVSDIQMPRMDGWEFCKNIKLDEKLKSIPVIFVTALSKEEEKRKGIEVGAQAYIMKSQFDQKNLLDTLERLI